MTPLSHADDRLREKIKEWRSRAHLWVIQAHDLHDTRTRGHFEGSAAQAEYCADELEALLAAVPVEEAAPPNASTRTLAMLDELAAKPELRVRGWNTYDGYPLDDRAVAAARTFLGYPWAVVPGSDGGVQLEIHAMGFDVEIEFSADGTVETAYAETVADQAASPSPVAGAALQAKADLVRQILHDADTHAVAGAVHALPDVEIVAAAVHEAWMVQKRAKGITSAPSQSTGEEQMRPYAELSNEVQEYDRATVRAVYDAIRAAASPEQAGAVPAPQWQATVEGTFQQRVKPWLLECFGEVIANDRIERNHRFLEEALELVQACGAMQDEARQLVDYVYSRDVGEPSQEVGGVMVTLAALCLANGLTMADAGEAELARILKPAIVEKIRRKQASKPHRSPLPAFPTSPPRSEQDETPRKYTAAERANVRDAERAVIAGQDETQVKA